MVGEAVAANLVTGVATTAIAGIEAVIADLRRQRAELAERQAQLDAGIARLEEAKATLQSGPSPEAVTKPNGALGKKLAGGQMPPGGNAEVVVSFLRTAPEPKNIDAIASGTGLSAESVRRVLYRTRPEAFNRTKVAGQGTAFWLKKSLAEPRTPKSDAGDLAGSTILAAAEAVLRATKQPMHYTDIAADAAIRGYSSKRGGDSARSFRSIMERNPDKFRRVGQGFFDLIEPAKQGGNTTDT